MTDAAPGNTPVVHPATGLDAERLADLHARAFDPAWTAATMAELLGQPGVAALTVSPSPGTDSQGFILTRAVMDEAEILTVAVAPEARRTGLGLRMVEAACAVLAEHGVERLFLEVAQDNAAAHALYLRAGFTETGRRRGYYPRPGGAAVDAHVLTLTISRTLPTA